MSIFVKMQNCVKWQTDTCLSVQNAQTSVRIFVFFHRKKPRNQQSENLEFKSRITAIYRSGEDISYLISHILYLVSCISSPLPSLQPLENLLRQYCHQILIRCAGTAFFLLLAPGNTANVDQIQG